MKRYLCFILFLLASAMSLNAQNDSIVRVTKYNAIDSRKGTIVKIVDKERDKIVTNDSWFGLKSAIRTCNIDGDNSYFLVIESHREEKIPRDVRIEYSDLVEVNKAFDKFFKEIDADCALNPDYLESKFITDDGFKIGYYVKKGKAHWFVDLDIDSPGYIDLKKPHDFSKVLKDAQNEIEIMKNSR